MTDLLPLFVNLHGRRVVLVGGGPVAAGKLTQLNAAGADVIVVAPEVCDAIAGAGVEVQRRRFTPSDLDDAWLVVAAATPEVNHEVAAAAAERRLFVNAVDDPANATAYLSGVVRRGGVTLAISTGGEAPGLAGLLREALDAVLPRDLGRWLREARRQRRVWRREGVPMSARRPLLLEALNALYDGRSKDLRHEYGRSKDLRHEYGSPADQAQDFSPAHQALADHDVNPADQRGHVSLVGAGPGDPGLLTRKAAARLRAADLVLYDALVDPRVLKLARRAQRFFVGKRAGRHALSQAEIHTIMIRAARRGRRVVRLKGGDPFVLGRGGEEALALQEAGVRFDVVPGVSSAVAAAALAGIPVTHRGVAPGFLTVSGHDEEAFAQAIDGVPHGRVTLVILMGMKRRTALAGVLLAQGWPGQVPVAVVADASLPAQVVWRGTIADLGADSAEIAGDSPAVIVVGRVAAFDLRDAAAQAAEVEKTGAMRASQG